MNNKILALIIAVIMISPVALVATTSAQTTTSQARDIKIGLVCPYSKSPVGTDMYRAAQIAIQDINNAGGVYVSSWNAHVNMTIDLADTVDDSPGNAVTPVTRAVTQDGVDLLIGGYGSAGTLANEVVAIQNRVPFIITGASNQLVTRRGPQGDFGGLSPTDPQAINDSVGMSYVFHYCTTTYQYSKTVVDFLANVMKPMVAADRNFSLALLYRNDAFGTGVAAAAKYWIQNESLPITVVSDLSYPTTTTDFQTLLTEVKGTQPDAVFMAENPDKSPTIITQGLNEVGLKTVYISVENNQDPQFYSLLGSAGDMQLLESKLDPFMNPSYLATITPFVQKYNASYGVYPGMMGADTYDAFFIAKAAIEAAGTVDKATVRTAIEQTNLPDSLLLTGNGRIQFSTGVNYHEIDVLTFMEQLKYNATAGKLSSVIVWPQSVSGVGTLKQADFTLPANYPVASQNPTTAPTQVSTTSVSAAPTATPSSQPAATNDSTMLYVAAAVVVIVIIALVAAVALRKKK